MGRVRRLINPLLLAGWRREASRGGTVEASQDTVPPSLTTFVESTEKKKSTSRKYRQGNTAPNLTLR